MTDKINPNHYKTGGTLQVIDIIDMFGLNFSRGNVIKYTLRAGNKAEEGYDQLTKEIEDLKKAMWYLDHEISKLENRRSETK